MLEYLRAHLKIRLLIGVLLWLFVALLIVELGSKPAAACGRTDCSELSAYQNGPVTSFGFVSGPLGEAKRWIGANNPTGKAGAWCAWFVSFVLERTGHKPLKNGMASSALSYGPHTGNPKQGDLVVMPHHVGFYGGRAPDGNILLTSGNWGHRVADGEVSPRQVVAYVQVR